VENAKLPAIATVFFLARVANVTDLVLLD